LPGVGRLRLGARVAQVVIDAPPPYVQAAGVMKLSGLRRRTTCASPRVQAAAASAGAPVVDVCFGAEGIVVTVRLRRRRRVCSLCGQTGRQLEIHDRRLERWRHSAMMGAEQPIFGSSVTRTSPRSSASPTRVVGNPRGHPHQPVADFDPGRVAGCPWW
jgi:hypothetical protein